MELSEMRRFPGSRVVNPVGGVVRDLKSPRPNRLPKKRSVLLVKCSVNTFPLFGEKVHDPNRLPEVSGISETFI